MLREGQILDPQMEGQAQLWSVEYAGLEYTGEVIFSESWDPEWGRPLVEDLQFRVVLLSTPRRMRIASLQDPRIAVAVPSRAPDAFKMNLQRGVKALREARAMYLTERRPDLSAVGRSMEEREQTVQAELTRWDARYHASGRIYSLGDLGLAPSEAFTGAIPELWASRMALTLLTHAHQYPLWDSRAFPHPFTLEDARAIAQGLFQADPEARPLVESFCPGLDITSVDNPSILDPQRCRVFQMFQEMLEEGGGAMASADLFQRLVHQTGLTPPLFSLYLLACLRVSRCEVELVPYNKVKLRSGEPIVGGGLTWDLVPEIDLADDLWRALGTIVTGQPPSWNALIPYTTPLIQGLMPYSTPEQVEADERRLIEALASVSARVSSATNVLRELSTTTGQSLEDTLNTLDKVQWTCSASDHVEFYLRVQESFQSPSSFHSSMSLLESCEAVAGLADQIVSACSYLDAILSHPSEGELPLDYSALRYQIDPGHFVANPPLWQSVNAEFQLLKQRHIRQYLEHHKTYNADLVSLTNRLDTVRPQIQALEQFTRIPDLGEPVGSDIPSRSLELEGSLRPCPLAQEEISLEEAPHCRRCGLGLREEAPFRRIEEIMGDLQRAMREYNRRLSSQAVRRILQSQEKESLEKFINLVQISDLSALANVMDPEVLAFLTGFLSTVDQPPST